MGIEERLIDWLRAGLIAAAPGLGLDPAALPDPELLAPKQKGHGDFATNVALALATSAGRPPREVAQAIADSLASVALRREGGGGRPRVPQRLHDRHWLHDTLRQIVAEGDAYGRSPDRGAAGCRSSS